VTPSVTRVAQRAGISARDYFELRPFDRIGTVASRNARVYTRVYNSRDNAQQRNNSGIKPNNGVLFVLVAATGRPRVAGRSTP